MDELDRQLLDIIQSAFPVKRRPFLALAERLGSKEDDVIARVRRLCDEGLIRGVGPVFDLHRLGYTSTLCAAQVAPEKLSDVAAFVNGYVEVTHNYRRDHVFNLWFTLIAPSSERIEEILSAIRTREGVAEVASLPAEKTYKIKVHFAPTEVE